MCIRWVVSASIVRGRWKAAWKRVRLRVRVKVGIRVRARVRVGWRAAWKRVLARCPERTLAKSTRSGLFLSMWISRKAVRGVMCAPGAG